MNILLTERCTRRCPYCFASSGVRPSGEPASERPFIRREDFAFALEFAARSGERVIGLLGGEPSLHPEFPELLLLALERFAPTGRIKVFTNGMWPREHFRALAGRLGPTLRRRLAIIVNVNPVEISSGEERAQQVELFEGLGDCCSLSANLYEPDLELGHLVQLITAHRLRPHIRLAIAQPLVGRETTFVPVEEYPELAPTILELAGRCDERDISLGFDCGMPLCMFTAEQLGRLQLSGCLLRATCAPTVDVGPDLSVWACFPLSRLTSPLRLTDARSVAQLVGRLRGELFELYSAGSRRECSRCRHFLRRQCAGGCAAHALLRRSASEGAPPE
jgi:sulfatase maturation enzyme AslB (radical SAM superfamily)